MFSLDHIHNQLIHFPIGLLFASVFFDVVGVISKNIKLHTVAWYTILLGVSFSVLGVLSGFIEDQTYGHMSEPFPIFDNHGSMQILASIIFIMLLIWRYKENTKDAQPSHVYIAISLLGLLILFYGAHLGAELAGRY